MTSINQIYRMVSPDGRRSWTSRDVMEMIATRRPRWRRELAAIHAEGLYYVSIATLGHELCAAVLGGCRKPWVTDVFAMIERGFEFGDTEATNLLVVGLFESMQGDAYHRGPPDLFERMLGPLSHQAWADLIEGWTGKGVRSVESWRRVIRNGELTSAIWSASGEWREVVFLEGAGVTRSSRGERVLKGNEQERFLSHFRPWMANTLSKCPRVTPFFSDEIKLIGPYDQRTIQVAGELATDGKRWFSVTLGTIPWPYV